jgi:hypothetical protein
VLSWTWWREAQIELCSDRRRGSCSLCCLLLGHGDAELARDLGLLGLELDSGLACGFREDCLLVGRRLVLRLLSFERRTFGK